jgi:hypothetical protein
MLVLHKEEASALVEGDRGYTVFAKLPQRCGGAMAWLSIELIAGSFAIYESAVTEV